MKNLRTVRGRKIYYDKIVAAKTINATQVRLQGLTTQVSTSYTTYTRRANSDTLHLYHASAFNGRNATVLRECYGDGVEVVQLKQDIRDEQEKHLAALCQYCMVGTADTFDHYLPQQIFPEFSVLSNNLIPACGYCNGKKWQNWKNHLDERLIINFYYDVIPNRQFLFCNVVVNAGIPVATFTINNPNGINAALFGLITRHFQRLETIGRIHSQCSTELTKIRNQMQMLRTTHNRRQASNFLIGLARNDKRDFGVNYCWAVLKEALGNNHHYLQSIGF